MADPPSAAAARVVAALARWQAETGERRHPNLVVTEVLDRVASGHAYLSVVFAHESDWFGRDVKPIADLFLRWLMERHPELGGPHLAFLAAHRDLVADETAEPADLGPFADLRRHATEFAVDWLARIPATHTICVREGEAEELADCVYVCERDTPVAELRLFADAIVRILARRYEAAHPERSRCVLWLESMASADAAPPGPASNRGEVVLQESFFPVESPGLAPDATASQRHAHVRDFARAWLDLIPFTHTIYVAEPWEEDLGDLVTVRIYRDDDDAEHRIHEDDAAAAIARRYGERYPAEAAAIVWLADYCK